VKVAFSLTRLLALAVVLFGTMAAAPQVRDSDFRVTDIKAQLLYERSGKLSVDLTGTPDFAIWNTVIGEGSAEEPADDVLVSAVISGPEERNLTVPLTLTALDAKGKVLASRTMTRILAGKVYVRSILLKDVGCAGLIRLEARLGASVRREKIEMDCGE
jgi:hypothetical protein